MAGNDGSAVAGLRGAGEGLARRLGVLVDDQVEGAERGTGLGVDERVPPVVAADLVEPDAPGEAYRVVGRHPDQLRVDRLLGDPAGRDGGRLGRSTLPVQHLECLLGLQVQVSCCCVDRVDHGLLRALPGCRSGEVRDEAVAGADHAAVTRDVDVDQAVVDADPLVLLLEIDMGDAVVLADDGVRHDDVVDVRACQPECLLLGLDVVERDVLRIRC